MLPTKTPPTTQSVSARSEALACAAALTSPNSSPNSSPVAFYSPDLDPAEIEALDPEEDWRYFGGNTHKIWIVQTYLRLKAAGYPVTLTQTLPRSGVVVVEKASRRTLIKEFDAQNRALIVAVRADHRPQLYADLEVIQNDHFEGAGRVFIQHWPQPGLLPRLASRGAEVKTLSYKGHTGCLHQDFHSEGWADFLEREELTWSLDDVHWHGKWSTYESCAWPDYRAVDIVLAVREDWRDHYLGKPASKLVNAWHAGVPAIVGPDSAFCAERRSELDFLQVHSLDEAMAAVSRLKREPELYRAMVKNGLERAGERRTQDVTEAWADLLFRRCQALAEARSRESWRLLGWWWKRTLHSAQRLLPGIRSRRKRRAGC